MAPPAAAIGIGLRAIALLTAVSACGGCARPQAKSQADPSLVPLRPVPEEPWRSLERFRFVADLDFDGVNDLMLSHDTGLFGNAGGHFDIYRGNPDGTFARIGSVQAHPLAAALKRRGPGEGELVAYLRSGAHSGRLVRYLVTAGGIEEIGGSEMHLGDAGTPEDLAAYERLFGGEDRLKPQVSRTSGPEVAWDDYGP